MVLQSADCAESNITLRIDTVVVILGGVGYALAQEGGIFDNLPFVGIHISEYAKIAHTLIYGCRLFGNHPLIFPELPLRGCDSLGVALVVDKLLVVTFTNAAAAEMKERISKRLSEKIKENPKSFHLKKLSLSSNQMISFLCLCFLQ